ncbi:MAG: NfeD family protein [Acidimicrobiales bacterium]|nr:NfeD family protein [Acidimicrobiales bacterium]
MRRRITLALTFIGLAFGILALSPPANAQTTGSDAAVFDIVQVSGFLDEINADFIEQSIADAESLGSGGVILQVNSSASVISDARLVELAMRIHDADVPVYGWAGPSHATAQGGMAQLMAVTDQIGIASFASFGNTGELVVTDYLPAGRAELLEGLEDTTISDLDAIDLGLIDHESPTLALFALGPAVGDELPGFESIVDTTSGEEPVREIASPVRLRKLSLFKGWMHSVASPAMAYLLFLIGASLLVFEFYTAGIGVAGVVGAVCFILGCYGLEVLPTRGWALALLVIAMLGYAIDVQSGVPRAWSVIATGCLIVGSLFLYDGFAISWITLLVGIIGVALSMVNGMPSMVRTRFGTPTIGREWMVGMMGEAVTEVKKDGVVMIDGAPWRAMVNRTTPILAGDPVRVVAIEGLFLEIEPEEGGARDYREMRG